MELTKMQKQDPAAGESANIKVKVPKRVLHFSDGVLEEFSEDETDSTPPNELDSQVVDPRSLPWVSWLTHQAWSAGSTALAICDYLGEHLASFIGITTPKYLYEIEEYQRLEAERLEKQKQAEGWSQPSSAGAVDPDTIKTNQPAPSSV